MSGMFEGFPLPVPDGGGSAPTLKLVTGTASGVLNGSTPQNVTIAIPGISKVLAVLLQPMTTPAGYNVAHAWLRAKLTDGWTVRSSGQDSQSVSVSYYAYIIDVVGGLLTFNAYRTNNATNYVMDVTFTVLGYE